MLKPDDDITIPESNEASLSRVNSAQWMIAAFLFTGLVLGALFYRLIMDVGLGHTSFMFIGIPVVLAIVLVLAPTPKSATGSILRGMTLALLIVAPLVGEGYLCILFASPLFLAVGLVIGYPPSSLRSSRWHTSHGRSRGFCPHLSTSTSPGPTVVSPFDYPSSISHSSYLWTRQV
jgi:hypothetical protein